MMGAVQRTMTAGLVGLSMLAVTVSAEAQQYVRREAPEPTNVSNVDRVWKNFTREAATVEAQQLRLEVRAFRVEERATGNRDGCGGPLRKNCARLNTIGQRVVGVESLNGGIFELLASYGLAENAEVGLIIPGYVESFHRDDGTRRTINDMGDITVYGKFIQAVANNCSVGGGLEMVFPPWKGLDRRAETIRTPIPLNEDGSDPDPNRRPPFFEPDAPSPGQVGTYTGFSTGELGLNPFISSRYQQGRLGLGGHVGYTFYTGSRAKEVFNYSAHTLMRAGDAWALRVELNGRVWNQFGETWHDLVLMPGVDFHLLENLTIRPTGLANLTKTAMDWGLGVGIATVF